MIATITPQSNGQAELSWNGLDQTFASTEAAMTYADQCRIPYTLLPFPQLSPVVLAVSPALSGA